MGFEFPKRSRETESSAGDHRSASERYNAYFPRVFAYVRSHVGNEMTTREIVVQVFCDAFHEAGSDDEERFRNVLFRSARRHCRPALKDYRAADGDSLNSREREVVSLVFDAGLTRNQIARLFEIRETNVSSLLMTGLRKLKQQTSPKAGRAYLKPA